MTARRRGFAHLHVHTVHSTLDAMTQHEEMCDEVLADAEASGAELAAIASTDHGTLSGTYKFSKMARKRGVTPLFGNEMYLANGLQEGARFAKDGLVVAADGAELDGDKADGGTGKRKTKRYEHITLLAETEEGWRNLIRINNAAQAPDAKWGKPRADIDLICQHSEGIIALTGCLGGPVLGSVARGDVDRARGVLRHMLTNGFDRDHLFLEIMEHGIPQEAKAMRTMLDLADEFEIAPVATNDAHFAAEGDAHAHEAWLCNATKAKFSDPDRWKFHGEGYWLRSAAEMRAIFDADERTQMACDNTLLIAERIAASGDIMTPSELRLPEFPVPSDYVPSASAQRKGLTGSAAYLNDQIREGAIRRYGSPLPAEVRDRLTYEFDVIHSMGLCCHPDTAVTMADGTVKKITEIRSGDKVWTHHGAGRVDYVESRHFEGELVEITSYGHSTPIRVTPEHPVLTQRGWVAAGEVVVGDEVVSSPRLGEPSSEALEITDLLDNGEATTWNLRSDGQEFWRMRPGRWGTEREALGRLPATMEPTDELMFLIGLYAAEGCLSGNPVNGSQGEIVWTLHEDETEIVAELDKSLRAFGGKLRVYRNYTGSKALRCVTTHHPLALLLRKLVGEKSHAKSFHPWVMNLPVERQRLVFRAWHMGDGTDRPNGRSTTYTVSEHLAWQGVDMLQRFGAPCSLKKVSRAKAHYRDVFNITWRPERKTKPTGRRTTDEGWIASAVRTVERTPYCGPVHNFEVTDHHAYIADGRVVHNCDYFLIVQDLISSARSEGIRVGPGRGSAAGAAVSYCLDIVNIDPIRYNLLFERFLNPERIGMPDIDIDFESSGRDWAFGYLARRYGVDRVARIGSFGVALSKGAIRAAARVLSVPGVGDDLSAAVPTNKNGKPQTFAEFMDPQNPSGDEFRRRVAQSEDHQAVAELAESWEGGIDKEGVHACGVIIGRDPLDGEVPLRESKGFWVTQWDGKDLDALQFLKLDALALRNLDVVTAAERLIEQTTGERIDADNPSLDPADPDPVVAERVRKTFELLQAGKTAGIFQMESGGITELCVQVGPTTLDDIAAIVALYRPGPLEAKMEERYALRKNGLETVDYGIFTNDPAEQAEIARVLDETYGTCLAGDTRVYSLSRGHLVDLRDVKVGELVESVDPDTFEATAGEVLNFASMGERDTFSLRLRSGDRIEATADHLVLTTDGWKCVADLREGDLVGRPSGAMEPESIDDDPTPELAAVLGYLLGDGGLSVGSSVIFSNKDESVLAAYRQAVHAVFPDVVHSERTGDRAVRHLRAGSGRGGGGRANSLTEWLRSVGLKAPAEQWRDGGPTSADKFVPLEFLRARPEVVVRLLAALWDCDGHVSAPGTRYATTYKTISKQLAEDVRFLLLRLGVASHIGTHDYSPGVTAYQVNVCGTGFDEIVGRHLASAEKAHRSAGREQVCPGHASMLPISMVLDAVRRKGSVRSFYEQRGWTRPHVRHTTISSGRAAQTNSELHDPILTKYLRLHWSQVVSIEPAGRQEVFDIEVAEAQNFVANGMVVHNCIFQEQLMRLGDVVAGFGPIERNRLQKAVSKKLQDEMAAVGELFIAGAMAERRNDDGTITKIAFRRDTAEKVWAAIKGAGNYAFNASHSYAYGWVTYITAFVKANWPTQYGAALLSVTKKADKRHEMLLSLAAEGITVAAPRINEALVETTVNDAGEVIIGMVEVRDVSRDDAEAIVAARDAGGPFTSLSDFARRCLATGLDTRVKIGAFEGLIEAGAFDEFAPEGRTNRMGMVLIARALGHLPELVPFDCEWSHLERARREAHRLGVLISPNPTKYLGPQIREASIGGIKASPLRKADEQRAGGEFTTAAIVSSWSEQSGHWGRRADVLLTGTGAAVRATIWDKTLHKLRAAGRIPEVGDLVLVKGKIVMRKARLENENGEMADGDAVADEKAELSVWEMQVVDVDGVHFDVPTGPPEAAEHWFVRPDGFTDDIEPPAPAGGDEPPPVGELPFDDAPDGPAPVVTDDHPADPQPILEPVAEPAATRPADRCVPAPVSPFGQLLEADPGVIELPWRDGEVDTIIVELAHGSLGSSASTSAALRIMRREVAAVVSAVVHLQRRPHSDGADIADEIRPLVDEMLAGHPVEVVAYDGPQPRSTWLVPSDGQWGVAAAAWAARLADPAPVVALAAPAADRTAA